jgi:hypothetical protein
MYSFSGSRHIGVALPQLLREGNLTMAMICFAYNGRFIPSVLLRYCAAGFAVAFMLLTSTCNALADQKFPPLAQDIVE